MISRIIKVSVRVINLSLRLQVITPFSTLVILDITETSPNNCLLGFVIDRTTQNSLTEISNRRTYCDIDILAYLNAKGNLCKGSCSVLFIAEPILPDLSEPGISLSAQESARLNESFFFQVRGIHSDTVPSLRQ